MKLILLLLVFPVIWLISFHNSSKANKNNYQLKNSNQYFNKNLIFYKKNHK